MACAFCTFMCKKKAEEAPLTGVAGATSPITTQPSWFSRGFKWTNEFLNDPANKEIIGENVFAL